MNIEMLIACPVQAVENQLACNTLATHADGHKCTCEVDMVIINVAVFQHRILVIFQFDDKTLLIGLVSDQFDGETLPL